MSINPLIGFSDSQVGYEQTKQNLEFDGALVRSLSNGQSFSIGEFELCTLKELRESVNTIQSKGTDARFGSPNRVLNNRPRQENVKNYMRNPDYNQALFQVASQFNLLEMASPNMTPEDGVDVYWSDSTQGPACATTTIGATIFRNYFVDHDGQEGQTVGHQINGLRVVLERLGVIEGDHYAYENGYVRLSKKDLQSCSHKIDSMNDVERMDLMGELTVGIHWGCQVNDDEQGMDQHVSLILCSALPLGAYKRVGVDLDDAEALGRLVQDGMQEATILAGVLNQVKFDVPDVVLTKLGNGVFGNPVNWVVAARNRALDMFPCSLDVLQFHFSQREPEFNY